ncbi:MAG: hypothetical protein U5Q03_15610 [Bacteroidota bacterium]|nr:hypothetical protein [Bacteroidota bacterium]
MKKSLFTVLLLITGILLNAQEWINNLPKDKLEKGNLTFYEIQKRIQRILGTL